MSNIILEITDLQHIFALHTFFSPGIQMYIF